jgi:hypothetical protein
MLTSAQPHCHSLTGIKGAQSKLPVSRKTSGKPMMNVILEIGSTTRGKMSHLYRPRANTAAVSLLPKILPGPIRFVEILAIATMYA